MKAIRRFHVRTVLPEQIAPLGELASNLHWSWHPPTRRLFAEMAPVRWERVKHDPVALLSSLSAKELADLAADEGFVAKVNEAEASLRRYLESDLWFQQWGSQVSGGAPKSIAYFSAEFGITEVLPQYSGGLGILAGDHLKAASDSGIPIVGVGLFYQTGYFAQSLNADGWQQETYPVLDPDGLPLSQLREPDGTAATIELTLPGGRILRAYVWKAQVGRVPLLLLDSDVHDNEDSLRGITKSLYGGGSEHRLQQELLLGMGGVKALRLYSRLTGAPEPDVYHANEGHAGFLGVERISDLVTNHGLTFDEAICAVRAATVFTTHTPVPAGIDRFGSELVAHYLGGDCELPGVPLDRLLALGAESYEGGSGGIFNMAMLGLRLAQRANGVAQLHGVVSREMFNPLWPGFDADEVPITSVTNGVHAPTWVDERVFALTERVAGTNDPHADDIPAVVEKVPTADIWSLKRELRAQLVQMVRQRMRDSWLKRGASAAELGWTESILDPDALTIGFARRAATYKRLTLMLEDPERFKKLLLDTDKPVQMIIAGKSHPADDMGKSLIQQMVKFTDDPTIRHRIAFLPNYDIGMARTLYPGCDVWLNNPLRPMEACGTSGMKAALNGGLNLSILDGWWDEWFDGENGWSIPTADGVYDTERRDDLEAAALYDLIENNVVPRYFDRDEDGIPQRWVAMMRHTLATLGPKVLASRMVQEYTSRLYTPAAQSGWAITADDYALAKDLAAYEAKARDQWGHVRVDHVESSGISASPQIGERLHVRAFVSLGTLTPDQVRVQVVYGHVAENDDLSDTVTEDLEFAESFEGGRHSFESELALARTGSMGYSVRVVPKHAGLSNVAEMGLVANA